MIRIETKIRIKRFQSELRIGRRVAQHRFDLSSARLGHYYRDVSFLATFSKRLKYNTLITRRFELNGISRYREQNTRDVSVRLGFPK